MELEDIDFDDACQSGPKVSAMQMEIYKAQFMAIASQLDEEERESLAEILREVERPDHE
jgi:hypothetical protein